MSRTPSAAASSSASLPELMPDFVGQTVPEAEAILKPLNVRIKKIPLIAQEAAGTIIEQDPVAGADFAQTVTLTVSTAPATVPDVTNKTFADAEAALTKLGFIVKQNPVFDQKRADGLVIAQNPPADTSNVAEVTLDVVRRPVIAYLADMSTVAKDNLDEFTAGSPKANGVSYSHGLRVEPYAGYRADLEYDMSRQYRKLSGALGLDDKSASAAVGKVEIFGDGRQLTQVDVPFGSTIPVELDVTDVLRLKITISVVDGTGAVVLGDFVAQGLQSEVSTTPTTTTR